MYNQGLPKSFVVFVSVIVLIIGIITGSILMKKTNYPVTITSEEQFGRMVYDCVSKYKNEINFKTTIDIGSVDFDGLFREIMDKDTYIGCELFRYDYRYSYDSSGLMNVKLRIQNPAWHRVLLTKWRVKQIAGKLRGLSRYDQIKAVHDYLVATNEYSITIGSAFNALYVNKSACNGYAFSFYAIMEELGIPATVEYGGAHAWNLVELDGEWYNVDCTWDDKGGKTLYYDYFLKSNDDFDGHEHYSATAAKSYDIEKAGPSSYYQKIPPYRTIMIISSFGIMICIYVGYRIIQKVKEERERRAFYGN